MAKAFKVFVWLGVPLSIGTSLGAALLLNAPVTRFRAFFRTALFAPVMTSSPAGNSFDSTVLPASRERCGRYGQRGRQGGCQDPVRDEIRPRDARLRKGIARSHLQQVGDTSRPSKGITSFQ